MIFWNEKYFEYYRISVNKETFIHGGGSKLPIGDIGSLLRCCWSEKLASKEKIKVTIITYFWSTIIHTI